MIRKIFVLGLLLGLLAGGFGPAQAQTYGAVYVSTFTYQNLSSQQATVVFNFYPEGQGTPVVHTTTLAGNGSSSLNVGGVNTLSAGFRGSAVISPTRPIAVALVQLPPVTNASKNRLLSTGFLEGSPIVLIPTALKNAFSTTSILMVQNADSVANDFIVNFYVVGSLTPTFIDASAINIPPGAAQYYDLGTLAAELGSTFNGSAVIYASRTSDSNPGRAVVTVDELSTAVGGKAGAAFEGVANGTTTVYMPSAMCQYSSLLINATYAIQNANTSTTATVTTRYSPSGVESTIQIPPYGKASLNTCAAGNAPGFLGSAVINSTQSVLAVGKISGSGLSTAFVGATSGAAKVVLPYVRWASQANYDNGTKQRTFLAIQNIGPNPIAANTITVKYYTASGVLSSTHTLSTELLPQAKFNSNPNFTTPSDADYEFGYAPFGGSAVVEGPAGSQLVVVVRAQNKVPGTSETAGEDYNGISSGLINAARIYVPAITKP